MIGRMTYADDNFGNWEIETDEDLEHYRAVCAESVWKKCDACGNQVKLKPDYGICDSCCRILERGGDPYG